MRVRTIADSVALQFGSMTVASNQSSVIVADTLVSQDVDVSVVILPHANVSITPHKQTNDIFLITTSDTADAIVDYIIASTS